VLPVSVAIGAVFAAVEVSIIAFCGQHGHRSLSGLVLAAAAVGSAAAGIAYGAVEWRSDVLHQFRVIALVFAALPFVLFAATSVPVLAAVGFVLGIGTAPTVITLFALIQQLVPVRAVTEGLAWVSSGFNVGYGLGAALAGVVADQHGARTAFLVAVSASVLAGVLAVSVRVRLDDPATPAPHRAAGGGTPVGAPPPVGRISDI
jgi:MFS family permease